MKIQEVSVPATGGLGWLCWYVCRKSAADRAFFPGRTCDPSLNQIPRYLLQWAIYYLLGRKPVQPDQGESWYKYKKKYIYKVFLSNTNNCHSALRFKVFISYTNNCMVSSNHIDLIIVVSFQQLYGFKIQIKILRKWL